MSGSIGHVSMSLADSSFSSAPTAMQANKAAEMTLLIWQRSKTFIIITRDDVPSHERIFDQSN